MSSPTTIKRWRALTFGRSRVSPAFSAYLRARTASLAAFYTFTSERITAPLDRGSGAARWFVRGAGAWITFKPGSRPRRMTRNLLPMSVQFVRARPFLADIARGLLRRLPRLRNYLRRILAARLPPAVRFTPFLDGLFSERERFVHMRLKAALKKIAD
jgi:hypothetical protein